MKTTVTEYEGSVHFDLVPETQEDAGLLVRLKLNERQIAPKIYVAAYKAGITATVTISRSSAVKNYIKNPNERK